MTYSAQRCKINIDKAHCAIRKKTGVMDLEFQNKDGQTEREFLDAYQPGDYDRPSVTVDILVFTMSREKDALEVLLIKRKNHPYINCWAFPGGFIGLRESASEAAQRELNEETGLTGLYLEQLYTFTYPERDPRTRVMSIAYMALMPKECVVSAGDDATEAAWFTLTEQSGFVVLENEEKQTRMEYDVKDHVYQNGVLSVDDHYLESRCTYPKLAFDHSNILYTGIARLRSKAEYTPLLLNLMPDEFTITEAWEIHNTVLGRTLHRTSFQKRILPYLKSTGAFTNEGNAYRPAALYRIEERNRPGIV